MINVENQNIYFVIRASCSYLFHFNISLIYIYFYHFSSNRLNLTWPEIFASYAEGHSNILGLIDLILSLPASTAECERGFSRMKLTKTEYRNKLKATTMSDLLMIQMNSDPIETYDPTQAIDDWITCGQRKRKVLFINNSTDINLQLDAAASAASTASTDPYQVPELPALPADSFKDNDNHDSDSSLSGYGSDFIKSANSSLEFMTTVI